MRTNQTILTLAAAVVCLWPAPAGAQKQIQSAPVATPTVGTVVAMDDRVIAVRSEEGELVRYLYRYTSATRWVNDSGDSVSRQSVRPGAAVTVHYRRGTVGQEASKVVLRSSPAVVERNLLSELALAVAALPPNRLPGAPPEVLGPPLSQVQEGPEPEPVATADPVMKRSVAKNPERRTPKAVRPIIVPKKRNWLADLFAPRGP